MVIVNGLIKDLLAFTKHFFFTILDQEKLPMFYGNLTDYFKILDQDDSTLLIGAR